MCVSTRVKAKLSVRVGAMFSLTRGVGPGLGSGRVVVRVGLIRGKLTFTELGS